MDCGIGMGGEDVKRAVVAHGPGHHLKDLPMGGVAVLAPGAVCNNLHEVVTLDDGPQLLCCTDNARQFAVLDVFH